jgi:hypothetical protein
MATEFVALPSMVTRFVAMFAVLLNSSSLNEDASPSFALGKVKQPGTQPEVYCFLSSWEAIE